MSPESKLLVILSTRVIITCCVECFFTKTELILVIVSYTKGVSVALEYIHSYGRG